MRRSAALPPDALPLKRAGSKGIGLIAAGGVEDEVPLVDHGLGLGARLRSSLGAFKARAQEFLLIAALGVGAATLSLAITLTAAFLHRLRQRIAERAAAWGRGDAKGGGEEELDATAAALGLVAQYGLYIAFSLACATVALATTLPAVGGSRHAAGSGTSQGGGWAALLTRP